MGCSRAADRTGSRRAEDGLLRKTQTEKRRKKISELREKGSGKKKKGNREKREGFGGLILESEARRKEEEKQGG